jgi:hypothetical protein
MTVLGSPSGLSNVASKNLHFLRVVASLLSKDSGDGVLKGLERVVGAIDRRELFVYIPVGVEEKPRCA